MTSDPPAGELFATIRRYHAVLDRMSAQSFDRKTLADKSEFASTTINEIVRKFQENELIVSVSDGFTTTLFGDLLNEVYRTFDQQLIALATDSEEPPPWNTLTERQEVMWLIGTRIDVLEHIKRSTINGIWSLL